MGARAETTGRGNALKDFVGPLHDKAVVELHVVQVYSYLVMLRVGLTPLR